MPYYEEALRLMQSMMRSGASVEFRHIYREFNAAADSLANEVLDAAVPNIRDNWLQ